MKSNNKSLKPLSASNNKTQVSKQVYQVAKAISGSAPGSADPNVDSRGTDTMQGNSSQVHFAVGNKLPSTSVPTSSINGGGFATNNYIDSFESDRQKEKQLEAEIMGESNRAAGANQQKSQAIEKNLNQMIKVLNSRLQALDQAAKTRLHLLDEDLKPLSNKMSDQAPKIVDEFDDAVLPKGLRDPNAKPGALTTGTMASSSVPGVNTAALTTAGGGGGGAGNSALSNLVSSDTVYIDPYHLVFRTKSQTESSKKLESLLEESFGSSNLRELKNKNKKNLNQSEKSKRTEQLKNEAKRMNRLRIEKKLQLNMENFVTRSVMDPEFVFQIPEDNGTEVLWPVTVKWSAKDPRSNKMDNSDGEFDPDLLLRYAIERINLPSGRKLFTWLIKQPMVQRYFVALFWLIKVKFFDFSAISENPSGTGGFGGGGAGASGFFGNNNSNNETRKNSNQSNNNMMFMNEGYDYQNNIEDREIFLLKLLALEYRFIVELLAFRSHAEHEKDFVYKYFPFILTNGIYFGFYYIFPGSRHLYTKGFKKTIYMQIIKIMHGFQICPISVKVSWAKLFPEDVHEAGEIDENEDGGEVFPVKLAIRSSPLHKYRASRANTPKNGKKPARGSPSKSSQGTADTDELDGTNNSSYAGSETHSVNNDNQAPVQARAGMLSFDPDLSNKDHNEDNNNNNNTNNGIAAGNKTMQKPFNNAMNEFSRPSTTNSGGTGIISHHSHGKPNNSALMASTSLPPMMMNNKNVLLENPGMIIPLSKTYLAPLVEKPSNIRNQLVKRQNNLEKLNAQEISPQMTLFLTTMSSTALDKNGRDIEIDATHSKQAFKRTVPVSWCAAGGSDTHQKRSVATDLHNDISMKLKQSQQEYLQHSYHFHHAKIEAVRENQKTLEKVSEACFLLSIFFIGFIISFSFLFLIADYEQWTDEY
jgi:hypothetical protein